MYLSDVASGSFASFKTRDLRLRVSYIVEPFVFSVNLVKLSLFFNQQVVFEKFISEVEIVCPPQLLHLELRGSNQLKRLHLNQKLMSLRISAEIVPEDFQNESRLETMVVETDSSFRNCVPALRLVASCVCLTEIWMPLQFFLAQKKRHHLQTFNPNAIEPSFSSTLRKMTIYSTSTSIHFSSLLPTSDEASRIRKALSSSVEVTWCQRKSPNQREPAMAFAYDLHKEPVVVAFSFNVLLANDARSPLM
jgi:hypothetical protein